MTSAKQILLFLFVFFIGVADISAQNAPRRFGAGLVAGLTASQIDGDISAGYHKVGLQGGLRATTRLGLKQSASFEILYSQRGCRNQPNIFPLFSTTLHYLEVPIQWHYHDWGVGNDEDEPDFFRVQVNGGLYYGRLMGTTDKYGEESAGITPAIPNLKNSSVGLTAGFSYFISRHVGFTARWQRALNLLYKPGQAGSNYSRSLNEHSLTFRFDFMF